MKQKSLCPSTPEEQEGIDSSFFTKLTLTNTVIIEIVPGKWRYCRCQGGQNTASVTGGAGEGTPALAGPAGGVTFPAER